MVVKNDPRPRQTRSRETEGRLIAAAIALLRKEGLEGCTIPAVAEQAGCAVGTIYRRFADKDALLRRVCEVLLNQADASDIVAPEHDSLDGVNVVVSRMVRYFIVGLRAEPVLSVAVYRFARDHPDAAFRKAFLAGTDAGREKLMRRLAACPELANRPDATDRARFAVMTCTATLQAIVLAPAAMNEKSVFDDEALSEMLCTMLTGFLVGPPI